MAKREDSSDFFFNERLGEEEKKLKCLVKGKSDSYWAADVPKTGSAAKGLWCRQAHFSLALKLYQVTTVTAL